MWETEKRLWVTSGGFEDTKIGKHREKSMKVTYGSLEAGEIYRVCELKGESVRDGRRLWVAFDDCDGLKIEKCLKLTYESLELEKYTELRA